MERPPLHICEHQPGLLGDAPSLASAVVLFLTLTCCGGFRKETSRKRERICERGQNALDAAWESSLLNKSIDWPMSYLSGSPPFHLNIVVWFYSNRDTLMWLLLTNTNISYLPIHFDSNYLIHGLVWCTDAGLQQIKVFTMLISRLILLRPQHLILYCYFDSSSDIILEDKMVIPWSSTSSRSQVKLIPVLLLFPVTANVTWRTKEVF